mmetsp:Transcript_19393/g.53952  ORF Transcript_19393/g.53952 Transcript_19393/m.53952 type:complete len:204 (-) Transcript_19393:112-723(-)
MLRHADTFILDHLVVGFRNDLVPRIGTPQQTDGGEKPKARDDDAPCLIDTGLDEDREQQRRQPTQDLRRIDEESGQLGFLALRQAHAEVQVLGAVEPAKAETDANAPDVGCQSAQIADSQDQRAGHEHQQQHAHADAPGGVGVEARCHHRSEFGAGQGAEQRDQEEDANFSRAEAQRLVEEDDGNRGDGGGGCYSERRIMWKP